VLVKPKNTSRNGHINGIVAPMEQGNMILVGEKDEDLN
jgi:hypothetical protein